MAHYTGLIEWKKKNGNSTYYTRDQVDCFADTHKQAMQYFSDIASEGCGEVVSVQVYVTIYTRPLGP